MAKVVPLIVVQQPDIANAIVFVIQRIPFLPIHKPVPGALELPSGKIIAVDKADEDAEFVNDAKKGFTWDQAKPHVLELLNGGPEFSVHGMHLDEIHRLTFSRLDLSHRASAA